MQNLFVSRETVEVRRELPQLGVLGQKGQRSSSRSVSSLFHSLHSVNFIVFGQFWQQKLLTFWVISTSVTKKPPPLLGLLGQKGQRPSSRPVSSLFHPVAVDFTVFEPIFCSHLVNFYCGNVSRIICLKTTWFYQYDMIIREFCFWFCTAMLSVNVCWCYLW